MRNSNQDMHEFHQKAAEYQELATHVAHNAATYYGLGNEYHLTSHERSRQALEQSKNRYLQSLQTHEANQQQIVALAYELWQARGCPQGSPEEDWYRAVEQLRHTSKNG